MKKIAILCIIFTIGALPLSAVALSPYTLSWLVDGTLGSAGLLTAGGSVLAEKMNPDNHAYAGQSYNRDDVNAFDRWAMRPYDAAWDKVSKILEITSFATLGILLAIPVKELLKAGTIDAEAFLFSYGTKQLAKELVHRARPYMYFPGFPLEDVQSGDWNCSFFSGHTTYAFAIAGLVSSMFRAYHPDSKWNIPVTVGCYALATTMAVARVMSGTHFLSDVLVAAAVGTAIGIFVPRLHLAKENTTMNGSLLGNTMMVSLSF